MKEHTQRWGTVGRPKSGRHARALRLLAVLLTFALPTLALSPSAGEATLPAIAEPMRYSLDNGLSVVLDPVPGRHTVAVVVSVDAGRRDQPAGWSGLAHLTEHMLFQGTPAAPGEFISRLERLGATSIGGETTDDWTRYHEVVPAAHLEQTLWLEADRFSHGLDAFDDADVEAQVRVIDRERELRQIGRAEIWQLVNSILYSEEHPYGRSEEHRGDVHAAHIEEVRWFFQSYYMPDRLTLAISGGFDVEEVRRWVERYWGPLRRGGIPAPPEVTIPPPVQLSVERRVLAEARRSDDLLCVLWPSPPWGAPGDAELDYVATELERRLEEELVDHGNALGVSIYQGSRGLASTFRACIDVPRRSGTLAPLQALDAAIAEVQQTAMSEETFASQQQRWMESSWRSMESSLSRAENYARRLPGFPSGIYSMRANQERYHAATPEGARQAAERYLQPTGRLVISISGQHEAPPEGRIVSDMTYVPEAE